jgi:hypothetical protein
MPEFGILPVDAFSPWSRAAGKRLYGCLGAPRPCGPMTAAPLPFSPVDVGKRAAESGTGNFNHYEIRFYLHLIYEKHIIFPI